MFTRCPTRGLCADTATVSPMIRAAAAFNKAAFAKGNGKSAVPGILKGVRKIPSTNPFTEVPVRIVIPNTTADAAEKQIATDAKAAPGRIGTLPSNSRVRFSSPRDEGAGRDG